MDQLCSICLNIEFDEACNSPGFVLYPSLSELFSLLPTCPNCQAASRYAQGAIREGLTSGLSEDDISLTLLVNTSEALHAWEPVADGTFDFALWAGGKRLRCQKRQYWLHFWIRRPESHLASSASRVRDVPLNTSDRSSLVLARSWLQTCLSGRCLGAHDIIPNNCPPDSELPGRLIDLAGYHNDTLRLVLGHDLLHHYAAVSYTWGYEPATWLTTTLNLHLRYEKFSTNDLPKTLSDAVYVAVELGVPYLWIDSICIIQDDDGDWNIEAAKMFSIYSNAAVTISADASEGSTSGLFNHRSRSHFEGWKPSLILEGELYGNQSLIYVDASPPGISAYQLFVYQGKLAWRGWCCQEHLLSPRILHFTEPQLIWECIHGYQSEDNVLNLSLNKDDSTMTRILRPWRLHYVRQLLRGVMSETDVEIKQMALFYWYEVIVAQEYSRREFSLLPDRLIAIAGVAKAIQNVCAMHYYAGIWDACLIQGLCWSTIRSGQPADEYIAPSWSWASQLGRVHYIFPRPGESSSRLEACAEITDIQVITSDGEPFSKVREGYLKLKGSAIEGQILRRDRRQEKTSTVTTGLKHTLNVQASLDDWRDEKRHISIMVCLLAKLHSWKTITILYLLLVPDTADTSSWRRVGLAESSSDASDWAESEKALHELDQYGMQEFKVL